MPDSRRLDILKRITAHLEGVTPDNGFDLDLTGRVFRGRSVYGESDPIPMVSILESPRPMDSLVTGEMGQTRADSWVLLLQGWSEEDWQNPTDGAYQLMAACELRLSDIVATRAGIARFPGIFRLGGRIAGMTIGPGVVRPADQISSRSYFFLPLVLSLAHDASDPFIS